MCQLIPWTYPISTRRRFNIQFFVFKWHYQSSEVKKSQQHHEKNSWDSRESNPGLMAAKRELYPLCYAGRPPPPVWTSSLVFCITFALAAGTYTNIHLKYGSGCSSAYLPPSYQSAGRVFESCWVVGSFLLLSFPTFCECWVSEIRSLKLVVNLYLWHES